MVCLSCEERARLLKSAYKSAKSGDLVSARSDVTDVAKTILNDLERNGIVFSKKSEGPKK
jgi:hypothetical protein